MIRFLDATLGRWTRHFFFVLVRTYYALFYNVSCSGKELLQDKPGALILATHVSRHDGPLISALLYSTARVRPTIHYTEFQNWAFKLPFWVISAIPMSSPKDWPDARRKAQKEKTLDVIGKVLANGNAMLLFPAGQVRRQEREIVKPYLTGTYDILRAHPQTPVLLLRIDGLGQFQEARYDLFWSFIGRKKGRRHVSVSLSRLEDLDTSQELAAFNARLERELNGDN
jgi:1-acyl-sn-glycerol-3-phosphate acyltransferase